MANERVMKRQRKKNSAKNNRKKIVAGALGVLLLVGGGVTYSMLSKDEPEKEEKEVAVEKEQVEAEKELSFEEFFKTITFDQELIYDKDVYKKYLQSFDEEVLVNTVNEQIDQFKETETESTYVNVNNEDLFEVLKDANGEVIIKPIAVTVKANVTYENLSIKIANKVIDLDEPIVEIGPILPGEYTYQLSGNIDGFQVSEKVDLKVSKDVEMIEIVPTTFTVTFSSPYEDTAIYVSGNVFYGHGLSIPKVNIPVGNEVEIYGIVEYEGKEYESERVKIKDSQMVNLAFPELDEKLKDVVDKNVHLPQEFPSEDQDKEIYVWQLVSEMIPSFLNASQNYDEATAKKYVDLKSEFAKVYLEALRTAKANGDVRELKWVTIDSVSVESDNKFIAIVNEEYAITLKDEEPYETKIVAKYVLHFENGVLVIEDKIVE